ncbi:Phosphatidylinositol-4-phosphate 5-kinase [Apophysomyces sp. BC1015]|nr:Phosphatidylinositol-4-phosphate 5-kinase [Apophysomyces sp. BC1015]KAG0177001.1 Phosphatidylinositol-4-phosphate 5-kinase [Apophysomyces sp. BC1021]
MSLTTHSQQHDNFYKPNLTQRPDDSFQHSFAPTAATNRPFHHHVEEDSDSYTPLDLSPPTTPIPMSTKLQLIDQRDPLVLPQKKVMPKRSFTMSVVPDTTPVTTNSVTFDEILEEIEDDRASSLAEPSLMVSKRHSTQNVVVDDIKKKEARPLGRHNTTGHNLRQKKLQKENEVSSISEEFEKELSARRKAFRRLSRRPKAAEDDTGEDRVMMGTRIGEGHQNYVLMYNMLTGIRIAVGRVSAKLDRELIDEDFMAAHKLAFDVTGDELTPGAKYDFKFKDYAPWVFRNLREKFGIDPADYLISLTSKYILSELGSPGKSGSFFYYSRDYRFIIKTIHHTEHKFMRKILKEYHGHVVNNPNTLLCRYYGLHRVKLPHGRKIHFVVMSNVFPPNKDVHETYDLKGSTVGRFLPEEEIKKNPYAVMKDLNWEKRGRKLQLGPRKRKMFVSQLVRDVKLLIQLNIMDYSLLVGVHDLFRGNKDGVRDSTLHFFQPDTKRAERRATMMKRRQSKAQVYRKAIAQANPDKLDASELPEDPFEERQNCAFYSDEGGFQSTDEYDRPTTSLYFMGIIDILTPYDVKKKSEHFFKSFTQDKHAISSVKPSHYGDRFMGFMAKTLEHNQDIPQEYQLSTGSKKRR